MHLRPLLFLSLIILVGAKALAFAHEREKAVSLRPQPRTQIQAPADQLCQGATLVQWDDGIFENGLAWGDVGVQEEGYYGAWAECYDSEFVCGIQFLFTQVGEYSGKTMNVFVWDAIGGPSPEPGTVICSIMGVDPGPPASWPDISIHEVLVCCQTAGLHFSGFWPDWPNSPPEWFIATDETGEGQGCPRTNIAPGIGYPTGWQHPHVVTAFENVKDLGIREYSGLGEDCAANPTGRTTWGAIKALY